MFKNSGDKVPAGVPCDPSAENLILSALVRSSGYLEQALGAGLVIGDFCIETNRVIFRTLVGIHAAGTPLEAQTLQRVLIGENRTKAAELWEYLSGKSVPNTLFNGSLVALRRKRILRSFQRKLRTAGKCRSPKYRRQIDNDLLQLVDEFRACADETRVKDIKGHVMDAIEAVEVAWEGVRRGASNGGQSGLPTLDSTTKWLAPGNLIVLASAPQSGATAMAIHVTRQFGLRGKKPVTYFSNDLSERSIVERILATDSSVELNRLENGRIIDEEFPALTGAAARLAGSELDISDARQMGPVELWSAASKLKRERDSKLIIVDRLDFADPTHRADANVWLPTLKAIAEDLDLAVLVLAQLPPKARFQSMSKLLQNRKMKRLRMVADVLLLLSRPFPSREGVERLHMSVEVRRRGPLGILSLAFDSKRGLLGEINAPMEPPPSPR